MKKLGILGGMGPESTLLYYRSKRHPKGYFPSLSIETVNMYEMLGYCKSGKYDELADYLLHGIFNLEHSGADFIIIASNTPHVVFDLLEERAHVPLLSIIEPTFQAVRKKGYKRIAWLGTGFTMEQPFFRVIERLIREEKIEAVVLGCTELPLMYADDKLPIPVFDTLQYHISGIIDYMFKE